MAIGATRRLTFTQQVSRDVQYKVGGIDSGRLALEVCGQKGFEGRAAIILKGFNLQALLVTKKVLVRCFTPFGLGFDTVALIEADGRAKTIEQMDEMAAQIDAISQAAASRQLRYIHPLMLAVAGQTYKRMMIGELTGIEAAQFLRPEEIKGINAKELMSQLEEPSEKALTYTNLDDYEKYISAAKDQGRSYRFMTVAELKALPDRAKSQLKGFENYFLVRGSGGFCWRSLRCTHPDTYIYPFKRFSRSVIRLVED